ncbi:MAG TPA: ribosome biogenesis GTP-binding protein YihA/YsxC [Bacillales bacterium]|nr:ribosome biogenesis GTP-binding protein YihA/YsxC [Bacillales bacterium]
MKVHNVELLISAVRPEQYPSGGRPEIALAGRSNVGKSSLINKLLTRKSIARTSQHPGKTQTLNFYKINEDLIFVDVPGYGYAKVSKKQRQQWGIMIETYLTEREALKAVILIVDVRHSPTKDDVLMYDWLKHFEIPVIVVATKADKIKKSQQNRHLKTVRETLGMDDFDDTLVLFSAEAGTGKDKLWKVIQSYL